MTTLPYGEWPSPISAAALADSGHPVADARWVGATPWWSELRPDQGGRYAVRRPGAASDAEPEDVLPAPWNARTRVHEYGGGAWTATDDGVLVFAEFGDQRLYRLDVPGGEPVALTPAPPQPAAWRCGELQLLREGEVWCVRERHAADGSVTRDLAAVPLDGSAADDPAAIRSVVSGSHFLAAATVSPDGTRLAWLAWDHPQMPWDGTELRVATLDADGVARDVRTLAGSRQESVLQPRWADDTALWALSDRSGFWNLYRLGLDGSAEPVAHADADTGGPLWQLGMQWYLPLGDGRLLAARTLGTDTLVVVDPATGAVAEVDLRGASGVGLDDVDGAGRVLLRTRGARVPTGLRVLDTAAGTLADVRLSVDAAGLPDAAYLPEAQLRTFPAPDGREVHAVVYPPTHPDAVAPDGELPPYIAFVHGGPTAHSVPMLSVEIAYWTSRGIGIVDVNYGGSTGYGRAYREQLRGRWGVVDVEDTVAALQGLAAAGLADPSRLAIEGGSAGGWTVLSALTGTDALACGVSYFGVAELLQFAAETHDFESRYLDGLIGPLPEARGLYERRAPVNNVDGLACPVLLLQGLDDPVVPPSQAERFRDAMVAKGLPHAYRTYDGESHGFRRRETIIDAHESSLSFYGQVLGFDPPGVARLPLWHAGDPVSDEPVSFGA